MLYLYHVNAYKYYELDNELNLGRTTGEIICADDGRMSGKHAKISVESPDNDPHVYIQDLGSKNHTAVNRSEIHPHKKIRLKIYALIEVGDQKFVLSDTDNINIQNLNEMIEAQIQKPLNILEEVENENSIPLVVELSPFEILKNKETAIISTQNEILLLEQNAKKELLKLEEAKENLISKAREKKAILVKKMSELKFEVQDAKEQMDRMKVELELKKKKIINLKDIPVDSTEELPE